MQMNKVNNTYLSMIIISAAAATARREEWLWTSWRVSSVSNFCLPGCCSRGYWYCWCLYCCYWCCCCCHGCCADIFFAQYIHTYVELDLKSCICSLTWICIALGFASVCKHSRPQLRNAQDLFVFNSNYDRLQIPNHDRAHITFQSSAALIIWIMEQ